MGRQTQRRTCSFAIQVAHRFYEKFTMEIDINASDNLLMDLGKERNTSEIDDEYDSNDNQPQTTSS